jgi:hypothetical protein
VKRLEEIAYQPDGRHWPTKRRSSPACASARERCWRHTPLVASFLGATTIRETGLEAWGWIALGSLVVGLVAAAILLAPWNLKFSVDAKQLYDELYEQAAGEAEADTLGWLAAAGYGYQALREENSGRVKWMSRISGALGVLMVVQTLAWLAGLAVH